MALRRVARILGAALLLALAADQVVQWTALSDGWLLGRRIAPFDPPIFCPDQQLSLDRIRSHLATGEPPLAAFDFDADLGWAPRPGGGSGDLRWDSLGSRIGSAPLAQVKEPGVVRAVAVGDSFTLGMEVGALEAWPAIIDEAEPRLEVLNLGMAGYGIDQALLRLERDGFPLGPDLVWFGWLPSATLRIATVYVPAMRHWSPSLAFKPRFELDADGALRQVKNPAATLQAVVDLVSNQERFFAAAAGHDLWVDQAPAAYAPFGSSLLHRFAAARAWITLAEREGRAVKPWLVDPESAVRRLTRAIFLRAHAETRARAARFVLVILPEPRDLRDRATNGRGYWEDLCDELRSASIDVCDTTEALQSAGGAENPSLWSAGGHYSADGNRIVAEAVRAWRRSPR